MDKCCSVSWFWPATRILLGFIMLWAFLDKLFGLGFSTVSGKSWLDGVSPTVGFLKMGTEGKWLASIFQAMAGNPIVDWLFMVGLLLIGLSLIFGIGLKIAGKTGALMMALMWLASIPPKTNPIIDDHVIYFLIFWALPKVESAKTLSLNKWWNNTAIVKKYPFLG